MGQNKGELQGALAGVVLSASRIPNVLNTINCYVCEGIANILRAVILYMRKLHCYECTASRISEKKPSVARTKHAQARVGMKTLQ